MNEQATMMNQQQQQHLMSLSQNMMILNQMNQLPQQQMAPMNRGYGMWPQPPPFPKPNPNPGAMKPPSSSFKGVLKAINVNKLTSAGCKMKIWIADWFAKLNNKMGGDLNKIQVVGQYFIEIWKALGMNVDEGQVEFLWSSEEIDARSLEYWLLVMAISSRNTLPRLMRCSQIMGRSEQDELSR